MDDLRERRYSPAGGSVACMGMRPMGEFEARAMANKYVYDFSDGGGLGRELLGGKGIGLAEMTAIGLPVPAGFTVTTEACRAYMRLDGELPEGLSEEIAQAV